MGQSGVFVLCLIGAMTLLPLDQVLAQKRARPAVADLEMLINDIDHNQNTESPRGSARNYDNLVTLAETLKRLQELDKYYSHQARPRYGRSVKEMTAEATPYRMRPFALKNRIQADSKEIDA